MTNEEEINNFELFMREHVRFTSDENDEIYIYHLYKEHYQSWYKYKFDGEPFSYDSFQKFMDDENYNIYFFKGSMRLVAYRIVPFCASQLME